MSKNRYNGVDSDAVSFIKRKAKKLTRLPFFTPNDYQDLQQELMIAFLLAWPKFDPSKGEPHSFIKAVVNTRGAELTRDAEAKKRWMGQSLRSLSEGVSGQDENLTLADTISNEDRLWGEFSPEIQELSLGLHQDLERFMATLPPDLSRLSLLLTTKTIAEVSVETGIPRSTIQDAVKKLRKLMEKAGLKIYTRIKPRGLAPWM